MMNKRIRELMIQAMTETGRLEEGVQASYQRFAELIVRECAEMGDNFDGQPTGNTVRKYLTAGDAIREYFGVE
jgi:hypothetical protein